MEVLQTSALPLGYCASPTEDLEKPHRRSKKRRFGTGKDSGAGNGIRTRDFDLGKVALYH
jgi:hypothetical protein